MALTKLTLAIIILILTITLDIQCVEGRHLKHKTHHNNAFAAKRKGLHGAIYANKVILTKATAHSQAKTSIASKLEAQLTPTPSGADDFRPTAPGHSPGAGHAIHN